MDPSSVAASVVEDGFGFQSNKHLFDWISELEIRENQFQTFLKETNTNYSSKQSLVKERKIVMEEIFDDAERIFIARESKNSEENAGWREDYLSNEIDSSLLLPP